MYFVINMFKVYISGRKSLKPGYCLVGVAASRDPYIMYLVISSQNLCMFFIYFSGKMCILHMINTEKNLQNSLVQATSSFVYTMLYVCKVRYICTAW